MVRLGGLIERENLMSGMTLRRRDIPQFDTGKVTAVFACRSTTRRRLCDRPGSR